MQLKTILFAATLASVTLMAPPTFAQTEACPQTQIVAPSQQTRIIRNDRFNYRFNIPNNYRTVGQWDKVGEWVFDPATYRKLQCLVKNQVPTEYPPGVSVYAESVNPANRNLSDWVKQKFSARITGSTKVANQSAIVYTTDTLRYQKNVSFFTPDRKYIITISEPYQYANGKWVPSRIFQSVSRTVLSSFTFAGG